MMKREENRTEKLNAWWRATLWWLTKTRPESMNYELEEQYSDPEKSHTEKRGHKQDIKMNFFNEAQTKLQLKHRGHRLPPSFDY
jgi:hypothetical protein